MANTSIEDRQRIDEFLPNHDFSAGYEIRINAPASMVYECLLSTDFSEAWLVRLLMTVRSGKRLPRSRAPTDLRQRLQGRGFVMLAEAPGEELVIGVAGRFWRADGGRCMGLTADDFARFCRPGYAKVAWNFKLRADSTGSTVLSTETRIKCFGKALWKFRLYLIFEQPLLPPPPCLRSTHMLTFQYRSKSLLWPDIGRSSCHPVPFPILPLAPTSGCERFLRLQLPRFPQPLRSSLWKFRLPQ